MSKCCIIERNAGFPSAGTSVEPWNVKGWSVYTRTKLYISNLECSISNSDIKVLFSEVGELKLYSIHYDKNRRSKGTAEVIFLGHLNALAAIESFLTPNCQWLNGRTTRPLHKNGRPLQKRSRDELCSNILLYKRQLKDGRWP